MFGNLSPGKKHVFSLNMTCAWCNVLKLKYVKAGSLVQANLKFSASPLDGEPALRIKHPTQI